MNKGYLPMHIHKRLTVEVEVRGNSNSEKKLAERGNTSGLFTVA